MKTIKTSAVLLFILIFSCTKQNIDKSLSPLKASASDNLVTFKIGQHFGGGIIFYIDSTGKHGLIAAPNDDTMGQISWGHGANVLTHASGTSIGTGNSNTNKIVNVLGLSGVYAALVCYNEGFNGFTDWYLPSKLELAQLFKRRNIVGGFSATNYWSSTEAGKSKAWDQEFGGGFQFQDTKSFTLRVRAIRSF
jgi:hypothetical protein